MGELLRGACETENSSVLKINTLIFLIFKILLLFVDLLKYELLITLGYPFGWRLDAFSTIQVKHVECPLSR